VAFIEAMSTKLTVAKGHYVELYVRIQPNGPRYVENMTGNLLMPLNNV
jgi:hypothetical protein